MQLQKIKFIEFLYIIKTTTWRVAEAITKSTCVLIADEQVQ